MRRRLLHWIGWTLGFGLLPVLTIAVLAYIAPAPGRSVRAFLAGGDVTLIVVGWLAASMSEMRDTRRGWSGGRDVVTFGVVFLIAVNVAVFGAVYGDRTRGPDRPCCTSASRRTVVLAVTDLAVAGILSTIAIAVGTSRERRRR